MFVLLDDKSNESIRIAENEKRGIVYHREGINGDYDNFDDVEKLLEFIKTGE